MEAQKLLGRGCEEFLCNVVDTKTLEPSLKDIPVVQEFPVDFSKKIPGMPRCHHLRRGCSSLTCQ